MPELKAQELRIGNKVTDQFYNDFGTVITIDSIDKQGINLNPEDDGKPYGMHCCEIGHEYTFDKLFGIPLTEEWLLRFGFEDKTENGIWSHANRHHIVWREYFIYRIPGVSLVKLDFVHQLQNLYFALTGEELALSENVHIKK